MSHSKVHSQGKVPFSWENKPGVRKVTTTVHQEYVPTIKLPSPPCPPDQTKAMVLVHELRVPLPPCLFQSPGVSKVTTVHQEYYPTTTIKLPPPPCPPDQTKARVLVHELQVPLPPCAFQPPPLRSSSKRGLWKHDDDPFLIAYKECTKTTKNKGKLFGDGRTKKRMFFSFSCKNSCSVRDDNLVKISQLPYSLSERERN